ncbi:hypothetical protein ACWEJ6_40955 [Nonomuraea sp. NPDC004702]
MTRIVHFLAPTGHTGGRVYLRMLQRLTSEEITWRTVPDSKRADRTRIWRTVRRHMAAITPQVRTLRDTPGAFVWGDLSLPLFTPERRAQTIFVFHHYEPFQHDSAPIQPQLWQQALQCPATVRGRRVRRTQLGPLPPSPRRGQGARHLQLLRGGDKEECRAENDLPRDGLLVYAGKAVHGKGSHLITMATERDRRLHVITTGGNTIGRLGPHFDLPRQ